MYHVPKTISSPIYQILLVLRLADDEVKVEQLSFSDLKSKQHLSRNPMGTSPTLVDPQENFAILESGATLTSSLPTTRNIGSTQTSRRLSKPISPSFCTFNNHYCHSISILGVSVFSYTSTSRGGRQLCSKCRGQVPITTWPDPSRLFGRFRFLHGKHDIRH